MYFNGQTLAHKVTGKLVQLAKGETTFAWDIGDKTAMYDEDGNLFADNIGNYTHITNALNQIESGLTKENKPDLRLKNYIHLTVEQRERLRLEALVALEQELFLEMAESNVISSPFYNSGSYCNVFANWFFERREAVPLYQHWSWYERHKNPNPEKFSATSKSCWADGPLTFFYNGQRWLYEQNPTHLIVIKIDLGGPAYQFNAQEASKNEH